ncbi:MAG: TrkH family potassium uptake protein [Candidatus Bipolaricaulaceae bacterium]
MGSEDLRIVLRDLGLVVPTVGVMAAASLPVAGAFGELYALWPLALTALVAAGLWLVLYLSFRQAGAARLKHGLLTASVGWLLVATLGALPLWLVAVRLGGALPYAELSTAFFGSLSGFTRTGLTVSMRPDLLPHALQWWRSLTEWVGGMGVIVLMLTLLAGPATTAASLYYAEARGERIHPSVVSTIRTMWWIFALFTFGAVVALWGTGMPPWEALNHGMTGISTGGFTLWPQSIGHYGSLAVEMVCLLVMVIGAISFAVHYAAMRSGAAAFWRDVQTRWLLVLLLAGLAALGLENLVQMAPGPAFRTGSFQFVSAMTCIGFQSADLSGWTERAKLLLAVGMVVGGAAGSTAGGIKVIRLVLLVRGVGWRLKKVVTHHCSGAHAAWGQGNAGAGGLPAAGGGGRVDLPVAGMPAVRRRRSAAYCAGGVRAGRRRDRRLLGPGQRGPFYGYYSPRHGAAGQADLVFQHVGGAVGDYPRTDAHQVAISGDRLMGPRVGVGFPPSHCDGRPGCRRTVRLPPPARIPLPDPSLMSLPFSLRERVEDRAGMD